MNDKETIRLLKSGKVRGLELLMDKYAAYVGTIIRRIVLPALSESDVEELAADVFTAVWRKPEAVTAENVRPYLAAAARNKALSRLRTAKEWQPLEDETLTTAGDIEKETDKLLLAEALASALNELDGSDRDILVGTYYYCRSVKETAEKLGITQEAAKTRLFRARARLKKILTERGIVYED
ncbi:MAG: sigma-70 family RNA polymerase sigma factor [Prevotella sp.]|nr:sigma-70 family RNA polymerase sigma factor [Prevotella sp.]